MASPVATATVLFARMTAARTVLSTLAPWHGLDSKRFYLSHSIGNQTLVQALRGPAGRGIGSTAILRSALQAKRYKMDDEQTNGQNGSAQPPMPRSGRGGVRPGAGRPPGQPNALTAQLREALMAGAINSKYGKDDEHPEGDLVTFFTNLANEHIGLFCSLFGKSIPKFIQTQSDNTLNVTYRSIEEVKLAMEQAGMSIKQIAQLEAMLPVNDMKIEEPTEETETPHDDEETKQ
jgi:hypothetical protein